MEELMNESIDKSLMKSLASVFMIIYALQYNYPIAFYISMLIIIFSIINIANAVSIYIKATKESRIDYFNSIICRFTASVFLIGVYFAYVIEFIKNF